MRGGFYVDVFDMLGFCVDFLGFFRHVGGVVGCASFGLWVVVCHFWWSRAGGSVFEWCVIVFCSFGMNSKSGTLSHFCCVPLLYCTFESTSARTSDKQTFPQVRALKSGTRTARPALFMLPRLGSNQRPFGAYVGGYTWFDSCCLFTLHHSRATTGCG